LDRVLGQVRDDKRVAAVWLFGSEAGGQADELSDIDLFVAFQEPAAAELTRTDCAVDTPALSSGGCASP
jgi:predicted nucleotidyltransferase